MRAPGVADGQSANNPSYAGNKIPNSRSVSMSQAVGTNPYRGGKSPVDGPWLDGSHGHHANQTWYTFGKTSDMVRPGPSSTFTILDENKYSINDGGFGTVGQNQPPDYHMVDWPGVYHNGACGIAFGDGHSEIRKWRDNRTQLNSNVSGTPNQNGNQDIWWLSVRTTALIKGPDFSAQ
jgi:prepilin-type processing-associated H-X9-DG protein